MKTIDGKTTSQKIKEKLKEKIQTLNFTPRLDVILVGNDPASTVYVSTKEKTAKTLGIKSVVHRLPQDTPQNELLELIKELNSNEEVDAILVQLPLPGHIDQSKVIESVSPDKDVDGFHPLNIGKLICGIDNPPVPCTPKGIIRLLKEYNIQIEGKKAVVIGRSNIVGKPLFHLLLKENATVSICHSRTKNIENETKTADILIVAVGKPLLVKSNWVKDGAVVIDVGVNRVECKECDKGYRIVGDVDFEEVKNKASYITPVPGGVGPMTIAMLMENTIELALKRRGLT